ncbi:MAG: 3-hydroxyacyl-CoA dehydrogenase NAD-binding domain-containing protein [Planctomycetota bacterium]|nr:3-hydroxyacyl-CoA dehydrogenase NAD-binding domain-containing protein [Planctomycetota bacterium]MDA1113173.1 3-hydroxyacyl-CoA dehydrogenase NAD-binding domain-containing protein [Planctomycetota bacterium]
MSQYNIKKFAVIGAGNMGSGIAQKIATEGHPCILVDLDDEKVERGMNIIRDLLAQGVERKVFRPQQVENILSNLRGTSDWSELADVDLVIEAVFEDVDVKRSVFERLSKNCKDTAILATNTSSFYVRDLVNAVTHPERLIGLHYFFHPAKNRLVEVIGHEGTSPEVYAAAWASQEAIGKTPIWSADAPGFVVNRYFVPWVNEGVRLLGEGVANLATIDWAAKKAFGVGMGPFELMNVTGVPISMHAANTLGATLGDFYAPGQALVDFCATGERNWDLEGEVDESQYDAIADRMLGVTFYVASKLVDEGVASVEDTDIGARVGLRWPAGPFEMLNNAGIERSRLLAEAVAGSYGLHLPKMLVNAGSHGIPIELVSLNDVHGVGEVRFNRPATMNALDNTMLVQFDGKLQLARATGKPFVLRGTGKAFVAGADIKFFVDSLNNDNYSAIAEFAGYGQKLFATLAGGEHATVSRLHGLALGGGAEMALSTDYIVASPNAVIGFPETSIGIFPGLGGSQRLPRRIGYPLAKYLLYTGQMLDARTALSIGLIDDVADFAELDATCHSWAKKRSVEVRETPTACSNPKLQAVWNFFDQYSVDEILSGEADCMGDPGLEKAVKRMGQKSYHALKLCEALFVEGAHLELDRALELESRDLSTAFNHADAIEGLSALLEGRRPNFQQPAFA